MLTKLMDRPTSRQVWRFRHAIRRVIRHLVDVFSFEIMRMNARDFYDAGDYHHYALMRVAMWRKWGV